MSDHLITEVLKIEEEADRIVNEARRKAKEIAANVHHETESIKTTCENEYIQKLAIVKARIAELQKSEEEGLRNELNGSLTVPPNTPLLYEVEVVEVK